MKDKLYQEYGLKINYLIFKKEYICFNDNDNKYMICKTNLSYRDLDELNYIVNYLDNYAIFFHQLVKGKNGYVFEFSGNKYVLLKIRIVSERIININEILKLSSIPFRVENSNLIEQKIDFLEEYVANYETKFENFDYFIGLAENSILLFNLHNPSEKRYLNHKRIHFNETAFDFYNPLNIVIDYRTRDLAEYAKSLFIAGNDKIFEYLKLIKIDDWYT